MKPILVRAAPLAALIAAASLSGCVAPPSTTVLSRLPEQAAGTTAHTLTPDERKRYDEIDRQVLREQNAAIAAEDAVRAWSYYSPPPVTYYGGYYGGGWGRGRGSGFGYGYPGWWW
ncbi:lipoprotein [Burkholderia pseudomallei]|nr:lipoprotein [Burkholderia pseudomallei]